MNDAELAAEAALKQYAVRAARAAAEHGEWLDEWKRTMAPIRLVVGDPAIYADKELAGPMVNDAFRRALEMVPDNEDVHDGGEISRRLHWLLDHITWYIDWFYPREDAPCAE